MNITHFAGLKVSLILIAMSGMPVAAADGPLPSIIIADYQLGGPYAPPDGTTVVARDSTAKPEPGLFNICYINGFQSQPGDIWPKDLILFDEKGASIADPNWPDEYFLDISTDAKRKSILDRLLPSIKGCAAKGFDAVEFDNLDSYTRSGGRLTEVHAIAFAKMLVAATKANGMAAGQKNAADLAGRGKSDIGFSFVVTEECHRWDECLAYTDVYGQQIINIEYTDDLRGDFENVCVDPQTPKSTVLRDRLLAPKSKSGHVYKRC